MLNVNPPANPFGEDGGDVPSWAAVSRGFGVFVSAWRRPIWPTTAGLARAIRSSGARFAVLATQGDPAGDADLDVCIRELTDTGVSAVAWRRLSARSIEPASSATEHAAAITRLGKVLVEPIGTFTDAQSNLVIEALSLLGPGSSYAVMGSLASGDSRLSWMAFASRAEAWFVRIRSAGEIGIALASGVPFGKTVVPVFDLNVAYGSDPLMPSLSRDAAWIRQQLRESSDLVTALDCPLAVATLDDALPHLEGEPLFPIPSAGADMAPDDSFASSAASAGEAIPSVPWLQRSTPAHGR